MTHDSNCRCRACNNRRHNRLVAEFKAAVTRRFGRRAYVDDVAQYHGQTVRDGVIGPWIDAGMSRGTFDLFVCLEGKVFWFDAKTGRGALTQEQIQFQSWIRAAGGTAEPLRSIEEGIAILEKGTTL